LFLNTIMKRNFFDDNENKLTNLLKVWKYIQQILVTDIELDKTCIIC